MAKPVNFEGRVKIRRQEALERRENDVKLLTQASNGKDVPEDTLKKLDRAKTDVVNLYAKLGLKKAE